MTTVTIEEAQAKLGELIAGLAPGEELVITRDTRPIARLTGDLENLGRDRGGYGSMRGRLRILAEDDEHLRGFEGYPP